MEACPGRTCSQGAHRLISCSPPKSRRPRRKRASRSRFGGAPARATAFQSHRHRQLRKSTRRVPLSRRSSILRPSGKICSGVWGADPHLEPHGTSRSGRGRAPVPGARSPSRTSDKRKLDAHLQRVRDLELRLSATGASCTPPTLGDTAGYNPTSGLNSDDTGSIKDLATDSAIPKVGKLMMDMMVMAMACDLTAVGTLQWSDSEAKYTIPWLGLPETHYFYENGGGYHPAELERLYTWYAAQHAYLLQEMAKIDMGGHTLLDESVVFFGSEVAHPATHTKLDMPFLLAGGGGLRTGRWVRYAHASHNDLLLSILQLFGDTRATVGNPTFCTGPLTNLT